VNIKPKAGDTVEQHQSRSATSREILADARDARADARDEQALADDVGRDLRDSTADIRDERADARDHAAQSQQHEVAGLLAAAEQRDLKAAARDNAANRRDMRASFDAFLVGHDDQATLEARASAQQDRKDSRDDRTSSARDRSRLSTVIGEVELPTTIPTQRGTSKPLAECTPGEVVTHAAVLMGQSVNETREAIDIVEHDGAASPRAKELVHVSRQHHEVAENLLWYVTEWHRAGTRPQGHATTVDATKHAAE
jgi:hypothetical protein